MPIRDVLPSDTPNTGRLVWNQNDQELKLLMDDFGLNVRSGDFGAIGDGVVDDRPAIQRAIDVCFAQGGGNVFLPPGSYRLDSGSLLLRDKVNLIGAGPQATRLLIGNQRNQPAITDEGLLATSPYAFGVVRLAHFAVDGGGDQNPSLHAAIATSAYYSIFENLQITNCSGHGFAVGNPLMSNFASQNQFLSCRIANCGQAGIYFDIHAVDCVVAHCFIRRCRYGVYINNGGMRVVNNVLFDHEEAAVMITQTPVSGLIALNDLNFNRRGNIVISRTTATTAEKWSQILVTNNVILGDALEANAVYDAILISSEVPEGISKVSVIGNKIYTPETGNRFRYGVHFQQNVIQSACLANHIQDCAAGAYFVAPSCADIQIEPVQGALVNTPALPPSGEAIQNTSGVPVTIYLTGGIVERVLIGPADTGLTAGMFRLPAWKTITIYYTAAPTWNWVAD
jgi:hypothetical protein